MRTIRAAGLSISLSVCLSACVSAGLSAGLAFSAAAQVRPVITTDGSLPGLGGAALTELASFRLNDRGQVAVMARSGGDRGIWRIDPGGGVTAVAVSGQPAPGANGSLFQSNLTDMSMNDHGQIAFNTFVSGLGNSVWISSAGGVLGGPAYTSGRTYLTSRLDNAGGLSISTTESGNDWIQYIEPGANAETFAVALGQEAFADNGYASFRAVVPFAGQEAVYRTRFGQGRRPIAQTQVENADGVTFTSLALGSTSVDPTGRVAFRASASRSGGPAVRGLWIGGTGYQRPVPLVEEGDAVPGVPGSTFSAVILPRLPSGADAAYFHGFHRDASGPTGSGIFSVDPPTGGLSAVASTEWTLPGLPGASIAAIDRWYVNDRGSTVLAIEIDTDGSGSGAVRDAIAGSLGGRSGFGFLLAVGDPLEVAPGDAREIAALALAGSDSTFAGDRDVDVNTAVLNERNEFLFRAAFTDGSSGLFVAAVPAPATPALLGLAGLTAGLTAGRRRRRR